MAEPAPQSGQWASSSAGASTSAAWPAATGGKPAARRAGADRPGDSPRRAMAAQALVGALLALSLLLLAASAAQPPPPLLMGTAGSADALVSAGARPPPLLLVPNRTVYAGHDVYFQLPPAAVARRGLLIVLHKCGRSASDCWPKSASCPECLGLPESVSKTKQALARGYALAAMSSLDRSTARNGRCWSWGADAKAVAQAVQQLPARLGLPAGSPVYVDGASSGGSIAVRLPQLVKFQGIVAEVIAPTNLAALLPRMLPSFPPALYIHMPKDGGIAPKVAENLGAIRGVGLPAAEIQVWPRPLSPAFFCDRSAAISPALSALVFSKLRELKLLNARNFVAVDPKDNSGGGWSAFRSFLTSDMKAQLPSLKGQAEQDLILLMTHIYECISLAWAHHETIGEYMTAALVWLEGGGKGNATQLARQYVVRRPATL